MKVGLIDASGRLVRWTYRPHKLAHPHPGWVEQSTGELWRAECEALNDLLDGVDAGRIAVVTCSSQRATFAPIDAMGVALTDVIGWQDHRGLAQCAWIDERIGAERYFSIAGLSIEPVASVSKILWLQRNAPEVVARTRCFGAHQTLLLRQLGVKDDLCSPSEASYFGLFDVNTRNWSSELLQTLEVEIDKLPAMVESGSVVGRVCASAAASTGLPTDLPIVIAGGDLQLGALGIGAATEGVVACGIGTGGGSVAYVDRPRLDAKRRLNCLCHVIPGAWELEGLGRAAGGTFRWFRDAFGEVEMAAATRTGGDAYDLLTQQAMRQPAGSRGLVVVPAWAGLGAPLNDAAFGGMIAGLRLGHDRGAVIRAFMEGICYEQRMILDAVADFWGDVHEVRAWGGGSKSNFWCQMQADIYGRTVLRMAESDASLLGAAICGAAGIGLVSSVEAGAKAMVNLDRKWLPDRKNAEVYDRYYRVYVDCINILRESGVSRLLADLPGSESAADPPPNRRRPF